MKHRIHGMIEKRLEMKENTGIPLVGGSRGGGFRSMYLPSC